MNGFRIYAPLLRPILHRDPGEIARRADGFRIDSSQERSFVSDLGRDFLGGYNAMLTLPSLQAVADRGGAVPSHTRPFFFEGAAMGYLPRGYLASGCRIDRAEEDLLAMDARFRYLYYVGLGFWFGVRYTLGRGLARLDRLEASVTPLYLPLCYDGLGFKVGFFDFPRRPDACRRLLSGAAADLKPPLHQGFGRALHFVFMDDEEGFQSERTRFDPERRRDLEVGRSLALGFTRVDRPAALAAHLVRARDAEDRLDRLLGITWALTARAMNDPEYFSKCLGASPSRLATFLRSLPPLCESARSRSPSYAGWQDQTRTELARLTRETEVVIASDVCS